MPCERNATESVVRVMLEPWKWEWFTRSLGLSKVACLYLDQAKSLTWRLRGYRANGYRKKNR